MGNQPSREEREQLEKKELEGFRKSLKDGQDFRVDQNIEKFTSLSSEDSLRHHYQLRRTEESDDDADWIQNLAEQLSSLTSAPELVGIGALAVAIFIDIGSSAPPKQSTQEALRCVFAEEKVSNVWDLIDECLKRTMMFINHRDELVKNIQQLERQLSAAITSLKNSMVHDGHMSIPCLKVWVNGAAFHIQMLIHLVRLGGVQTSDPVERLVQMYQRDLLPLFMLLEQMIKSKCTMKLLGFYQQEDLMPYLVDEESGLHQMDPSIKDHYGKYLQVYYEQRYGRQQQDIQQYFSKLKEELPRLTLLTGASPLEPETTPSGGSSS